MTMNKVLKMLEIDDLLVQFQWLKDVDYVDVESMTDDIEYMLEAELDEDGDMIDLVYTHGSYRTSLTSEPSFWVWDDLRNGNYVITM